MITTFMNLLLNLYGHFFAINILLMLETAATYIKTILIILMQ